MTDAGTRRHCRCSAAGPAWVSGRHRVFSSWMAYSTDRQTTDNCAQSRTRAAALTGSQAWVIRYGTGLPLACAKQRMGRLPSVVAAGAQPR